MAPPGVTDNATHADGCCLVVVLLLVAAIIGGSLLVL
jgi:hypothetical protein